MKIYGFRDYKAFLKDHIQALPKRGRGESLKIARFLGVHPTMLSQVLNNERDLSLEHGQRICEFLHLDEDETRYFIMLILVKRAGSVDLRTHFEKQLEEMRARALKTERQIKKHRKLTEEEAGRFYSSWKFSATRLMLSLPRVRSVQDVAEQLGVSEREVAQILRFLIEAGLIEEKGGKYQMAEKVTFINAESPHYSRHHLNWRMRAVDACGEQRTSDYTFTAPMTLSRNDFEKIRGSLLSEVKRISETVTASTPDVLACLNIDFFKVGRDL